MENPGNSTMLTIVGRAKLSMDGNCNAGLEMSMLEVCMLIGDRHLNRAWRTTHIFCPIAGGATYGVALPFANDSNPFTFFHSFSSGVYPRRIIGSTLRAIHV